ncbi:MAG: potassium transporter TrkA [Chloroflexi bacterium UTCFX4]|jgi:trk system potassium uptake protein TrkA|nr:MAG: potassium transporter TrkA [Chloroflexi bacterium UTCFX4]
MKLIILGCGRVGVRLAHTMHSAGHEVTIVDRNRDAFTKLGADYGGKMILGTGIDQDVLRKAGIEQADAFVAVTNGDNTNAMAAQIAKHIFGVPRVVARLYDPVREETYRLLGLETVCATVMGADKIRDLVLA